MIKPEDFGPALRQELRCAPSDGWLRLVLMLSDGASAGAAGTRAAQRRCAISHARQAAADALPEIDRTLARYDGRRLSDQPTALGTIAVETSPSGLYALAELEAVRGILADQPLGLL